MVTRASSPASAPTIAGGRERPCPPSSWGRCTSSWSARCCSASSSARRPWLSRPVERERAILFQRDVSAERAALPLQDVAQPPGVGGRDAALPEAAHLHGRHAQ